MVGFGIVMLIQGIIGNSLPENERPQSFSNIEADEFSVGTESEGRKYRAVLKKTVDCLQSRKNRNRMNLRKEAGMWLLRWNYSKTAACRRFCFTACRYLLPDGLKTVSQPWKKPDTSL